MKAPTLVPVNMRRADKSNHPDIRCGKRYLCKIGGEYYVGRFDRQWYGLNFDGWEGTGLQFDAPGTNESEWQAIWEFNAR